MIDFDFSPKTQPFPHQLEAIEFLKGNKNSALFDEQGLGKSKVVIDTICFDIDEGFLDGALIVCKKSLIKTWENEIRTHSHLFFTTLIGNQFQRKKMFQTFSHFYIINYESLIQELKLISMLLKVRQLALILDESHKIKNPDSIICQTIFKIKDLSKKKIIITGTPVANKPEDLWSQYFFLDNGMTLGYSFENFRKEFGINISGGKSVINKEKLEYLRRQINNTAIRRTKDKTFLELPEKKFYDIHVNLSPIQRKMYDQLKDELYLEIKNMDGEKIVEDANNILKKLLRLTQISSNPRLIDRSYNETPGKFIKLDSLVRNIINKGDKVIVWSNFVENVDILKTRYNEFNSLKIHGDISMDDRNKFVEWFQKDEDYKILIANPAAAREGLTLTASNNAIYLDRSFNMVDYLQSQDRIHRISQKKKCNIFKLVARNTIDEYIENLLFKKQRIAQFIQDDITTLDIHDYNLSKDEIIMILGGK